MRLIKKNSNNKKDTTLPTYSFLLIVFIKIIVIAILETIEYKYPAIFEI
jgi:hypothetical protein